MDTPKQKISWIERIEELIAVLEGSSIGELELTEAGTEIIIRRRPDMMMVSAPNQQANMHSMMSTGQGSSEVTDVRNQATKEDNSVAIVTPLTGVYYTAPSPTLPDFVAEGDVIQVGQVIALVEAMKVFNDIQAEISGRVTKLVARNGDVVQKGDALLRIEPA